MIDKAAYEKLMNDVLPGLQMFVRDCNLSPACFSKYKPGMFIREKGFTDASCRVMGMVTTHRYSILSNHMGNLSAFEHGTNWGLCVAQHDSHFKVLDVYEYKNRTQILLLHLPDDGRWKMMENVEFDIEKQLIQKSRQRFENKSVQDPAPELATKEWLSRCASPIGMDDHGNLFPLEVNPAEEPVAKAAADITINPLNLKPGPAATEEQKKALERAQWYFKSKRGLENDFIFSGSLLEKLEDTSRKHIERAIVVRCNKGDSRFFDALEKISTLDLCKAIKPDYLKINDDDYVCRSSVLKGMFLSTHNVGLLIILLKMATTNTMAFYELATAIKKTDWNTVDTDTDEFRLFMRGLITFTSIRRLIIRREFIYRELCSSNLHQGKWELLTLQDISFFMKPDPWTECASRDPLIFFKSLELRERYLATKDINIIVSLLKDSVIYEEAFDVFAFMKGAKEIDEEVLTRLPGIR